MQHARWKMAALAALACALSAFGGFALGLRTGSHYAWGETMLWRAPLAMEQVARLRAGNASHALIYLEYQIDMGIGVGDILLNDALWRPTLLLRGESEAEYANRLTTIADYRKQNPGPQPRSNAIEPLVERYATKAVR